MEKTIPDTETPPVPTVTVTGYTKHARLTGAPTVTSHRHDNAEFTPDQISIYGSTDDDEAPSLFVVVTSDTFLGDASWATADHPCPPLTDCPQWILDTVAGLLAAPDTIGIDETGKAPVHLADLCDAAEFAAGTLDHAIGLAATRHSLARARQADS